MQDDADLQERGDGWERGLQTWLCSPPSPSCGSQQGEALPQAAAVCGGPSRSPGTHRLADDQVAGEGDASREDGGRHGDVEAEVKQHVPALPRDEDGAGRGTRGTCELLPAPERDTRFAACVRGSAPARALRGHADTAWGHSPAQARHTSGAEEEAKGVAGAGWG